MTASVKLSLVITLSFQEAGLKETGTKTQRVEQRCSRHYENTY